MLMNSRLSNPGNGQNRINWAVAASGITVITAVIGWIVLTVPLLGRTEPLVEPLKLPGPMLLWQAICQLKWKLLTYSATTLLRVVAGLLSGAIGGVLLGLLMTRFRIVMSVFDPLIEALRPCPPIALIPFVILWFGLGTSGQIFIVGLGCFMVVVVTTINAVSSVNVQLIRAAYSLGADSLTVYRAIVCRAITPHLVSAIRIASATGFGLTVAAEYLGAQGGLGFLIRNARTTLNTESIMLAIILLGVESYLVDSVIRFWGRRSTAWLDGTFMELAGRRES